MGVSGLWKELARKGCVGRPLRLAQLPAGQCIAVDAAGMVDRNGDGWAFGGDYLRLRRKIFRFVQAFARCGVRVVAVVDGGVDGAKMGTWRRRRREELRTIRHAEELLRRNAAAQMRLPDKCFFTPAGVKQSIAECFVAAGCEVVTSIGEADRELAEICIRRRCWGVLTDDSDLFAFDVPHLLLTRTLMLRQGKRAASTVLCFDRAHVCSVLGVAPQSMPLFCSLAGNDFTGRAVEGFHRRVCAQFPAGSVFESLAKMIASGNLLPVGNGLAELVGASMHMYNIESRATIEQARDTSTANRGVATLKRLMAAAKATDNVASQIAVNVLLAQSVTKGGMLEDSQRTASWIVARPLRRRLYALLLEPELSVTEEAFAVGLPDGSELQPAVMPDVFFPASATASLADESPKHRLDLLFGALLGWGSDVGERLAEACVQCPGAAPMAVSAAIVGYLQHQQQPDSANGSLLRRALLYQSFAVCGSVAKGIFHVSSSKRPPILLEVAHAASCFTGLILTAEALNFACYCPVQRLWSFRLFDGEAFHSTFALLAKATDEQGVSESRMWATPSTYQAAKVAADVIVSDAPVTQLDSNWIGLLQNAVAPESSVVPPPPGHVFRPARLPFSSKSPQPSTPAIKLPPPPSPAPAPAPSPSPARPPPTQEPAPAPAPQAPAAAAVASRPRLTIIRPKKPSQ